MIYQPGAGLVIRSEDAAPRIEVEMLKTGNNEDDYEYYILVSDVAVDVHNILSSAEESFDTIVEALKAAFAYHTTLQ